MIKKGSRISFFIFVLFLLALFSSSCIIDSSYMDSSKPIIELSKYYKIYEMPLRFERKLPHSNLTIEIYSFINNKELFEKIYNFIFEGVEILNEYLNFGQEMYKEKYCKWKIYVAIEKETIKNAKIKWKKEKDKNFSHLHSLLRLYDKEENWDKQIISGWLAYQIHELCHFYFSFWHEKKSFGYKKIYSWFEEGFSVYLEYKIRNEFLPEKAKWQFEQFERVKKDDALFKEIWGYNGGYLVYEHKKKILKMKLTFKSNEKINKYIYDFWKHYDDLFFLSAAIVMTMEDYYGKEKFKEILKMYRDGIEKEKLKEMAEKAIRAKW